MNIPFPTVGGSYVHTGAQIIKLPSADADKPIVVQVQEPSTVAEAAAPEEDSKPPAIPLEDETPPWER